MNSSRSKVLDNPRGNGIQSNIGETSVLEEEAHFLHCGRRRIWMHMHEVGRFCGGKMSEFISSDFYFLNEV